MAKLKIIGREYEQAIIRNYLEWSIDGYTMTSST